MSVGSNAVKSTAKTALKENYLSTVASSLILIFSWIVCLNCAALLMPVVGEIGVFIIAVLMTVFLLLPMALGLLRSVWRLLFGVSDGPLSVFYWFSDIKLYSRALKLISQFGLRIILWLAILNLPSLLLFFLSHSFFFEMIGTEVPVWTANFGFFSVILRNVSFVIVFFVMLKYYMAPILVIADENMDVNEAMYTSAVIAKKSSIDFISLIASSILWIIATFLLMPLPFTLPVLLGFYAVHTRFSITEYNLHISKQRTRQEGFI